jgi:hypothetical protein
MIMTGNDVPHWIDFVFDTAVRWLYAWAEFFGASYEEVNVWLFCVAWPLLTFGMMIWIVALVRDNRRMRKKEVLRCTLRTAS